MSCSGWNLGESLLERNDRAISSSMPALTVDRRRTVIVAAGTFLFFLFLFLSTASQNVVSKSKTPIAELAFTDSSLSTYPCNSDYLQVAHDLATSEHPPILDERQLVEIATIMRTSAYARNGRANNVLVYGLGECGLVIGRQG